MAHETELKLSLPETALAALRRHPLLAGAEKVGRVETLVNTYYDTPDQALRRNGVALRTRKQGRQWLQTVKCAARSRGGLASRPEWEHPYEGRFDFSLIDADEVAAHLKRHAEAIGILFTTRFRREVLRIVRDNGAVILAMIDKGTVEAGQESQPLCELELELEAGQALDLFGLACDLAADLPLAPSDISKAERGFRLLAQRAHEPMRAAPSPLSPGMSPVAAFDALAHGCLSQWQHNVQGAMASDDPEFIHQLRVALRRLRSALKLFAPALPLPFVAHWSQALGEAAADLGEARDLDVMRTEILAPVAQATAPDPLMTPLLDAVDARRQAARATGIAHLRNAGHGRLMLQFTRDLMQLPSNALIDAVDLRTFAGLQLEMLRKKARKRLGREGEPSLPQLHALRISLKRLRYGLEFFVPLLPARQTRAFVRRLARIQDALGYLNDLDVARQRLDRLVAEAPDLARPAAFVAGFHTPRCVGVRQALPAQVRKLLWGGTPWR